MCVEWVGKKNTDQAEYMCYKIRERQNGAGKLTISKWITVSPPSQEKWETNTM
jgi:hypothetical protein